MPTPHPAARLLGLFGAQSPPSSRSEPASHGWHGGLTVVAALASLAAAAVIAATLPSGQLDDGASALSAAQRLRHEHALLAFREGRYAAAYGRFAALADSGHVPSAEISLVMWRHGRSLFGNEWAATPLQVQRWNALASEGGVRRLQAALAQTGGE